MKATRKVQPLAWQMHAGPTMLLRGDVLTSGKVLLASRAFFRMLELRVPTKFTAKSFIEIDAALRFRFAFVRVISCEAILTRRKGGIVTEHILQVRHTLKKLDYIVKLPKPKTKAR